MSYIFQGRGVSILLDYNNHIAIPLAVLETKYEEDEVQMSKQNLNNNCSLIVVLGLITFLAQLWIAIDYNSDS